jgi:hypothetical protein
MVEPSIGAAATVVIGINALKSVFDDIYETAKGNIKKRIKTRNTESKLKGLYSKISNAVMLA